MKQQVIYKIINTVNGKFYVGSTNNAKERFRTHRKKLNAGTHHCAHLQAAWRKYGAAQFIFKTVVVVSDGESLQSVEDLWLKEHVGKPNCYNTGTRSGAPWRGVTGAAHPSFGVPVSQEQKAQISATLKQFYAEAPENHPRYGKQHTEETKAKIRAKKLANPIRPWLGKERSEETRQKIGDTQRGVKKGPRVYTPEGLEKARENMRRHAKEQIPLEFEAVKAKFPQEVQDKYDFSNAVYTGALERIQGCVCPQHGVFSQYAAQFRKGRGCPKCGAEQRVVTFKASRVDNPA